MDKTQQDKFKQEDEISIKRLILKLQEWWRFLLSKWILIFLFSLIGAALGLTYALLKKPKYVGELTFVLEETKGGGLGAYAGLASQLGLDLGTGGSGIGVFAGDNILEFLTSRLMVEKTLLSAMKIGQKERTLADIFLDIYKMQEAWTDNPKLKGLHFPANAERGDFSREQDSILGVIYEKIVKLNLEVGKPDKKLSFIAVRFISPNERFSKAFTERLVKEATDFYVNTKTKRSRYNVDLLQAKADSLESLLNRKTYSAAAMQDINQNPVRRVATVRTEVESRDKAVIQTIYGEVIKNLELSRINMAQETPVIQIIDTPILPLPVVKFGKLKGIILGGFLGCFFTSMLLIVIKTYREILA